MSTVSRGRMAEDYVAKYLSQRGCEILARNYTIRGGEIDLIVRDGGCVAFVEVKARGSSSLYAPREAVTKTKRMRLIRTAEEYLKRERPNGMPRFDVVELILRPGEEFTVLQMHYLKNAFDAG